jgi:phage tail sheath protein FI
MARYTYPGVYVEELSSGVRTIASVGTSLTAFVGRALRGPVNTPKIINNYGDFERLFGGLWADSPMSYAVWDFFLNGGAQAVIVRLYSPLFADEAARLAAEVAARATATAAAAALVTIAQQAEALPGSTAASVEAAVAGGVAAGDVEGAVGSRLSAIAQLSASAAATASTVSLAARASVPASGAASAAALAAANAAASAGEAAALAAAATAVAVRAAINGAAAESQARRDAANAAAAEAEAANADPAAGDVGALQARVDTVVAAQAAGPARDAAAAVRAATVGADKAEAAGNARAAVTPFDQALTASNQVLAAADTELNRVSGASVVAAVTAGQAGVIDQVVSARAQAPAARVVLGGGLTLEAASAGAWGSQLRVRVEHEAASLHPLSDPFRAERFTLLVRDGLTGKTEAHRRLSVQAGDVRSIVEVLNNESELVRVFNAPPATRPNAHAAAPRGEELTSTTPGIFSTPADAGGELGADGSIPSANEYEGSLSNKTGIYALEKTDLFNLLCIPPPTHDTSVEASVWVMASAYCRRRRAFLIIDPPHTWVTKDQARDRLDDVSGGIANKDYAAIFFPRLRRPDPLRSNQLRDFAPSGVVAGIFARTDANRGVWKAPAGLEATLAGVPQLTLALTDDENGELNPLGINCLRAMPASGRVVWGARTMAGDDRLAHEWKYIPVRRLALFIEESLYRGTHWVVFEGNDEKLWSQIRLNVGAFMHSLFRQGAFQGVAPKDAYFVKCDSETTTQTDINQGVVNIVVGFAPLKPAEFVVLKIQQIAGDIQT